MKALPFSFHFPRIHGRGHRWLIASLVPIAVAILFFAGYWPRHAAQKKLATEAAAAQKNLPRFKVTSAVSAAASRSLTLPGTLVPNRLAQVNARATGYVRTWHVDIGDRVRAGDVLAELDTPELDQQLEQARGVLNQKQAALEQAKANREYARVTAAREDALLAEGITTQQKNDAAHAQVKVADANIHAAEADIAAAQASVGQLQELVAFGRVTAPFDGRITQRNIEIGSLVAPTGASAGQPLFRMEQSDPITVVLQVPQAFALSIKNDEPASLMVRQIPERVFEGKVARTSGTLDPASRTLAVEIDVPNSKGELLGGMFTDVTIAVALAHPVIRVPSSAVINDATGVHVATVDPAGQVHLVAVQRGLDNGSVIDVVEGLHGGEQVVVSPGGDMIEGMRVEAVNGP